MTPFAPRLFREIPMLMTLIAGVGVSVPACGSITAIEVGDGGSGGTGGGATGTGGTATGTGGATGGGGGGGTDAGHDGRADATDGRRDADASDASTGVCQGLNETMCKARPDCAVQTCNSCSGQAVYAGCYRPGVDTPPACLGVPCPACAGLTEAVCKTRPECRPDYCPGCSTGQTFTRCSAATDPQPGCLPIACPPPLPCSQATTLALCEARTDCHSVFVDKRNCGCLALGCCASFSRCADGDQPSCKGVIACDALQPYCEGPYVVSFTNACYEGCVHMKDCAP